MPLAGRVGDRAKHLAGTHDGPAKEGSPDVLIDGHAALRVGDPGEHWKASQGSRNVLINGLPAHRVGDETAHHGDGHGQLVDGSRDVFIGDGVGGTAAPVPHDRSLYVEVTDALGRVIAEATALVSCPHRTDVEQTFTGSTTLSALCRSATVTVKKALQKGTWDPGAQSGGAMPPTHAHVTPPQNEASPAAHAAPKPAEAAHHEAKPVAAAHHDARPAPAAQPATAKPTAAAPEPPPQHHVVHAPGPAATAPDAHEARIVRPSTPTATVKLTTVHNWVELVYRAFGFTMPTGATEIAILGVREASLDGKGGQDKLEAEAAAGEVDAVTFTREGRDADFHHATTWNDLLFVAFTGSTPAHAQHVEVFECTIDAGKGDNDKGTPITLEGKLYGGYPGAHNIAKYPGSDICLHLFSGQYGKMPLIREYTKSYRTLESLDSARNPLTAWQWCSTEDNSSIHMHFGAEQGNVGLWSTGCTVLHHHYFRYGVKPRVPDPAATRYRRFMELYRGAANKKNIPYLVVSSKYVRSYAEWVRLVDKDPGEVSKPESVILKAALEEVPGMKGRYVPSIMTLQFAREVEALAASPSTSHAHAANLRSSLELATFTLAI